MVPIGSAACPLPTFSPSPSTFVAATRWRLLGGRTVVLDSELGAENRFQTSTTLRTDDTSRLNFHIHIFSARIAPPEPGVWLSVHIHLLVPSYAAAVA